MPNWPTLERFWSEAQSSPPVTPDGYLTESPNARRRTRTVFSTDEVLTRSPCRALLGEAGIGKSTALTHIRDRLPRDEARVFLDFADVLSADDLRDRAFQSGEWERWRAGEPLHLLLDSLDESHVAIARGEAALRSGLARLHGVNRLTLTVACRPVAFPPTFRAALRDLWGERYEEYELCPLRRSDVEAVLAALGIPAIGFFAALEESQSHLLAARPQTLDLLTRLYRRDRRLPGSRTALYRAAALALCEEPNEKFRAAGRGDGLTPDQRYAISRRVAVVTICADRATVWTGRQQDAPDGSASLHDLGGGSEPTEAGVVPVDHAGLMSVLTETGRFKGSGANEVVWAHRSFAEFLAAERLYVADTPEAVLDALFLHPSRRGVLASLAGTAGWLAVHRPDWFWRLVEIDPRVLFGLDPTFGPEAFRARAAETLLTAAAAGRLNDRGVQDQEYRRFRCGGLAAAVRPFVTDASVNVFARRMSFRIAAANGVVSLVPDLVAVAMCSEEPAHVRAFAAHAVADLSEESPPPELLTFLSLSRDEDPDDELLGTALAACWRRSVSTAEVFRHLRPPHKSNFFGEYAAFCSYRLPDELLDDEIPVALDWAVRTFAPDRYEIDPLTRLRSAIIRRAYGLMGVPEVATRTAQLVWACLQNHLPPPGDDFEDREADYLADGEARRALAVALVPLALGDPHSASQLVRFQIVRPQDAPWVVDQILACRDESMRRYLVDAAVLLCQSHPVETMDVFLPVFKVASPPPEYADGFRPLFESMAVQSIEADRLRADARRRLAADQEWDRRRAELDEGRNQRERAAREELTAAAAAVRAAGAAGWARLTRALALARSGAGWAAIDLSTSPGWAALAPDVHGLLPAVAQRFLSEPRRAGDVHTLAGLQALHLLHVSDPIGLDRLPQGVWATWTPAILGHRWTDAGDRNALLREAARRHPGVVLAAWGGHVATTDHPDELQDLNCLFGGVWPDETLTFVRTLLASGRVRPGVLRVLWDRLLSQAHREDVEHALSLLRSGANEQSVTDECRFAVATALMAHDPSVLLTAFGQLEPTFFRDWATDFSVTGQGGRWGRSLSQLSVDQLESLYRRLAEQCPSDGRTDDDAEDGDDDWDADPQRPQLTSMRSAVLDRLESLRTTDACDAIGRLAADHPGADNLGWRRVVALENLLESTWAPLTPGDLLRLLRHRERRLIQGPADLVAVILESLERYQLELRGHTPSAFQLWNEWPVPVEGGGKEKRFRPKEEERLSDAIKLHLVRDLSGRSVAVNREVQIRPRIGAGGEAGERTDLQVDAVADGTGQVVSVVVEVKGGWNAGVTTAMADQLRDRYLRDSPVTHGLYVVGWYSCPQWDPDDDRAAAHRRNLTNDFSQASQFFMSQAAEISTPRQHIRAFLLNAALR